jgi:hypothetical protein
VEIENTFELAITGLSDDAYDLDQLHDMLRDWLLDNFEVDEVTTLAGTRTVTSEPEMFIFHMTTWKATCEVLSDSSRDRFLSDFKSYEMLKPPQLLHSLNTSGLGKKPGNIRKDLIEGASMVTEGLDKLRWEFNAYKETNNQLHQATQLQLTATTSTLTALTSTVNDLGDCLVNTQRAVLFQSQEVSLSRAITDIKSNAISLKVNLLMESDEEKRCDILLLLRAIEEEETRLKSELARTSHDFLSVVQGTSVGQLVSSAPSMSTQSSITSQQMSPHSPGLSHSLDDPALGQPATGKKQRLEPATDTPDMDGQMKNEVRDYKRPLEPLTVADDDMPDASMKRLPKTRTRLGCRFFGVFDTLRDLSSCHHSCTVSCRSNLSILNPTILLTMFIFFVGFVKLVNASAPPSSTATFSIYALNANGLVQPVKLNDINSAIKAMGPQVFVLGETKTKSKLKGSLPSKDYDIYEEPGEQDETHHPVKWGIVVGVQKDIQIAQRLEVKHKSLKGRIIALDLVLPTSDGRCLPHRFVGVYAPWNPGDEGVSRSFWHDMTEICRSTSHAWTIAGDLNATVS